MSIGSGIEAEFLAQYYDLRLFAELGMKQDVDSFTLFELEAFRHISQGINKAQKDELKKHQPKKGKR